ncbi:hypothetical protein Bbelb_347060 [Branchiostoma belcheri]|nr:hypothetical protein Bbelb_347060 [Branchiostoma belcheri]
MAAVYLQEQGFEEYARARRLSEEESRQDRETEPYRSKYKARELLLGLSEALKGFLDESQAEENVELTLQLGEVFLHLGSNFSDTEEVPTGEKYFSRCADLLQGHKLDQRCVNTILTCLNQLGILWVSRSEPEKALEILQEAEELYKVYMHNVGQPPLQLHELLSSEPFGSPKSRLAEFEKTHTLTLYYLAQTYPKLGDNEKSAAYCHLTLSRQLQSGNYQPLDWATNCATLSQYYITRDSFTQGRHCLGRATNCATLSQYYITRDSFTQGRHCLGRATNCATLSQYYITRDSFTQGRHCLGRATNCATLSQYYITRDNFTQGRHCLGRATNCATLSQYYITRDNFTQGRHCLGRYQLHCYTGQALSGATNCATLSQYYITRDNFTQGRHCLGQQTATLSQYYITRDNFTQGRHCLASASCVMSQVPEPCDEVEDGENETGREKLERRRADIARCWLKYCLVMLQESRQALMDDIGEMDRTKQKDLAEGGAVASSNGADGPARHHGDEKSLLRFESLELTLEDQVTDRKVTDFDQARGVFLVGQKYVNAAKQFYVLDGHVTDFVEITQDWSQLFRALSFFEQDFERRCKMHKRRVDMLQSLLSELNQQHYLLVCRQIMYEIAETFSEMLDLKVAIAETGDERPTIHAVKKINTLAQQSIGHYQMFLDSLRNADKEMPKTFNEDTVRPALVAHFCVGRLYSKFLTSDPQLKLQNMSKSLDHYQYLVDYCTSHPDITPAVQSELEICTEMSQLLPIQMEKIRLTLT